MVTTVISQGMNAFVNGEIGIVKFIGRVDFSDGIWVGVVLKNEGKPSVFAPLLPNYHVPCLPYDSRVGGFAKL